MHFFEYKMSPKTHYVKVDLMLLDKITEIGPWIIGITNALLYQWIYYWDAEENTTWVMKSFLSLPLNLDLLCSLESSDISFVF